MTNEHEVVHLAGRATDARYTVTHEDTGNPAEKWVARVDLLPMIGGSWTKDYVGRYATEEEASAALLRVHDGGLCVRCGPVLRYVGVGRDRGLTRNGYRPPMAPEVAEEFMARPDAENPVFGVTVDGRVFVAYASLAERKWLEQRLGRLVRSAEHLEVFSRYDVVYPLNEYVQRMVTR